MKNALSLIVAAALATSAVAQSQPAAQNPAPTQQTQTPSAASPNAPAQQPGAQGSQQNATQPAAPSAEPGKKTIPQAKTKEELDAYQNVVGQADLSAAETAAKAFETQFPQSELRWLMYYQLMLKYQGANNSEKTLDMARKVIALDPTNTPALVMAANVIANQTRDTDLDRDQNYAEAIKDAQTAISTIDTGLVLPANFTPEQEQQAKNMMLGMANAAMGFISLQKKDNAQAEQYLQKAVELGQAQPDPINYLRLALSQDNQQKYAAALANSKKAQELAPPGSKSAQLAKQETDRLTALQANGQTPPKQQ